MRIAREPKTGAGRHAPMVIFAMPLRPGWEQRSVPCEKPLLCQGCIVVLGGIEHHFDDYTMCPDVLQFLTYMAGRTKTAKLGSMVVVLPMSTSSPSPMLAAHQAALASQFADAMSAACDATAVAATKPRRPA